MRYLALVWGGAGLVAAAFALHGDFGGVAVLAWGAATVWWSVWRLERRQRRRPASTWRPTPGGR